MESGDLRVSPINNNYRNLALIAEGLKYYKESGMMEEFGDKQRKEVYDALKETQGLVELHHYGKEKYEGLLHTVIGKDPKHGFAQRKAWRKRQDLSARSTITLEPDLGMDEVGLPSPMAKKIFQPFAIQKMVQMGYHPFTAIKHLEEETPLGWKAIDMAMKERPVLMNRAPTLHKHGVQSFLPKRLDGKSIKMNPLSLTGFNADIDGDTMSVFVPVSPEAVDESYSLLPSKMLYVAGPPEGSIPTADSLSQNYILGLWYLSKLTDSYPGKVDGINRAKKLRTEGRIKITTKINLAGVGETSLGKEMIAAILPKSLVDRKIEYSAKELDKLARVLIKEYPNKYSSTMSALKDVGNQYAHKRGVTIGFSDINIDRDFRDKLVEKGMRGVRKDTQSQAKAFINVQSELNKEIANIYKGKGLNNFTEYADSGAKGNPGQFMQINAAVGVQMDTHGNLMPPISKSWAEGIDSFDYFNHNYGVRKAGIDVAVNTQDSGALNKALLANTRMVLITEDDCLTKRGLAEEVQGNSLVGRYAAKTIMGVVRYNQLIDGSVQSLASRKKLKTILVRSPLTCETIEGICIKCYGLMADGRPPEIGVNVGVIDGQAVSERSTQLTLRSKHTGGSATAEASVLSGFKELESVLKVPSIQPNKATLATTRGQVTRILPSITGGKEIYIKGAVYLVPSKNQVLVSEGDWVNKGQALSSGVKKPQEVAELTNFLEAQQGLVKRLDNVYEGVFHNRTFETVIRGISNQSEILESPNDTPWYRGDHISTTAIEAENRERKAEGKELIKYSPYFKSIDVLPSESEDWLSKLSTNRLKAAITEGVARGHVSNIHGVDPLPGYMYATEFGQDGKYY